MMKIIMIQNIDVLDNYVCPACAGSSLSGLATLYQLQNVNAYSYSVLLTHVKTQHNRKGKILHPR